MRFNATLVALLCSVGALAAPHTPVQRDHKQRAVVQRAAFDWNDDTVRGVNLGGWLVLEPWITPSLFSHLPDDVVDEYTLGKRLGVKGATDALRYHWDHWVVQADMDKISNQGFNMVRVPIGYWAFDNSDGIYADGSAPYLDKAIAMARAASPRPLKVVIDLHGAPGSQNGFDNSGQKMAAPLWQTNDHGATRTLAVLETLQAKYSDPSYDNVILGIEILNEPLSPELDMNQLKQFIVNAYKQQRTHSQSRVVIMHDGFQNTNFYNNFMVPSSSPSAINLAIDHHEYQVFNQDQVKLDTAGHLAAICSQEPVYNGADKWTFVGEWSAAMTDCAPWLNGRGTGSRYEGSLAMPNGTFPRAVGSCANKNDIHNWNAQMKQDTQAFIAAQIDSYERTTRGWTFWNFKTENSGAAEWDAFALIDAGIFPYLWQKKGFSSHKC